MGLEIDVVTIFPSFFKAPFEESLLKRAQKKGLLKLRTHNLRDYTHDRHKTVDDKPFGGGPGMVMKPEPIFECVEAIQKKNKPRAKKQTSQNTPWVIILDPQGEPLDQKLAKQLARKKHLVLIAGHYEGIDDRVREHLADQSISIGDFVTMGGEAPALCLIEAVSRLIPGVLGNKDSLNEETFSDLLEYPQYTRPRDYRGYKVPDILVSGNHEEVRKWRHETAMKMTHQKRPDLIRKKV